LKNVADRTKTLACKHVRPIYAKPNTHSRVRKLIKIPVSKINLIDVFQKLQNDFINKCVARLTNEYFRRFGTFNLHSASRSWQSDC